MINISRKIKNIITGSLLIVLVGLNGFTVYKASNEMNTTNTNNNILMQDNNWSPPNMPNGDSNMIPPDRFDGENSSNRQVPKNMPNDKIMGDDNGNRPTPPTRNGENSMNGQQPKELPSQPSNSDSSNENPMSKDNSFDGVMRNMMPPDGMGGNFENITQDNSLSKVYYVVFGVECLLIALTIMYLLMSNFNKKSFKETFEERDKVLIFALATVLLTLSLTYLDNILVTDVLSTNQTVVTNTSKE